MGFRRLARRSLARVGRNRHRNRMRARRGRRHLSRRQEAGRLSPAAFIYIERNVVSGQVLAEVPFPPSVKDIYPPALVDAAPWLTKFSLFLWLAAAIIIVFFLVAYRK